MFFDKSAMLIIFGNPTYTNVVKGEICIDDLSAIKKTYVDTSYPPLDIIVRCDSMLVLLDLPGVDVNDFVVYQHGINIVIEGRKQPTYECCGTYNFLRIERMYCNFRRIVALTESIDSSKTKAVLEDGVLCIELYFNK